jgi:hypothetical protein
VKEIRRSVSSQRFSSIGTNFSNSERINQTILTKDVTTKCWNYFLILQINTCFPSKQMGQKNCLPLSFSFSFIRFLLILFIERIYNSNLKSIASNVLRIAKSRKHLIFEFVFFESSSRASVNFLLNSLGITENNFIRLSILTIF